MWLKSQNQHSRAFSELKIFWLSNSAFEPEICKKISYYLKWSIYGRCFKKSQWSETTNDGSVFENTGQVGAQWELKVIKKIVAIKVKYCPSIDKKTTDLDLFVV